MESTVSVSKGVFLFKKDIKKSSKSPKKTKNKNNFFGSLFMKEPWYITYKKNWKLFETALSDLHHRTYSVLLNDIIIYLKSFYGDQEPFLLDGVIPSATLLTGVNQPDHVSQFLALVKKIRDNVSPHVAMISSQDVSTLKHLVENAVCQLIMDNDILDSSNDHDNENESRIKVKKNQCTMKTLQKWYHTNYVKGSVKKNSTNAKPLVIIIPDFESFNCSVLQDFVMIVSSYVSSLPILFVFGVATSVSALHKSFPYHVSSKLLIKVFQTHSSPVYMNQVLEEIFLTHTSPFHLSGKGLELLTDVFLFYDFSVTGLIQSVKYCMMDHYYGDNTKSLCCKREMVEEAVMNLSSEDLENVRRLLSFRGFLEAQDCRTKIALFENDEFFRDMLSKEIIKLHDYIYSFYLCVRLLFTFTKDLPRNIFGQSIREVYTKCAMEYVTSTLAFKDCIQLLNFQSQMQLVENIKNSLKLINSALQMVSAVKPLRSTPSKNNLKDFELDNDTLGENFIKNIRIHFILFLNQLENANTEATVLTNTSDDDSDIENGPVNRYKLKEKLLKATRVEKLQSQYEMIRSRFISYIEQVFILGLQPPKHKAFHEIYFFSDVSNVKKQIVGSPRGALHTALSNPVQYLQCSCCHLQSTESIIDTLPDLCLAYKLHLECGKHINLYDWLQAFATVLKPEDDEDQRNEDPIIQSRFTRVVAELQFLGFIKTSKRKTDHVMRLTW